MKIKLPTILIVILLTSVAVGGEHSTDSAIKLLDKIRKNLTSLSAHFEQYEIDANENVSEKLTGKVWLNTPNQFKWEYHKPFPQLIIANGTQVWVYDKDLEQVTIKKQKNNQNPIYVLLNKEQTEKNYQISLMQKEKGSKEKLQWVEMLPKEKSDDIKVVWLGIEKKTLKVIKLQNQLNNIVVFNFSKSKRNPKLSDEFFTFEIPKGTDVIRDGPAIGEF